MQLQPDTNEDLDWRAFRYIAGEMSADESAAFEGRLAIDQTTREAVASAVELSQSLAALPTEVIPFRRAERSRRPWLQPAGWMAIGAAACLAVVLFHGDFTRRLQRSEESARAGVLASLWASSELRHGQADAWESDLAATGDESLFATTEPDSDSDLTTPDWLLRALLSTEDVQRPDANWEDS